MADMPGIAGLWLVEQAVGDATPSSDHVLMYDAVVGMEG